MSDSISLPQHHHWQSVQDPEGLELVTEFQFSQGTTALEFLVILLTLKHPPNTTICCNCKTATCVVVTLDTTSLANWYVLCNLSGLVDDKYNDLEEQ